MGASKLFLKTLTWWRHQRSWALQRLKSSVKWTGYACFFCQHMAHLFLPRKKVVAACFIFVSWSISCKKKSQKLLKKKAVSRKVAWLYFNGKLRVLWQSGTFISSRETTWFFQKLKATFGFARGFLQWLLWTPNFPFYMTQKNVLKMSRNAHTFLSKCASYHTKV